jgi:hypothetical protein
MTISDSEVVVIVKLALFAAVLSSMAFLLLLGLLFRFGLELVQIVVEAIEPRFPELSVRLGPVGDVFQRAGFDPAEAPLGVAAPGDQAGALIAKGAASSPTERSPAESRARIALLVGSARAKKVLLNGSVVTMIKPFG